MKWQDWKKLRENTGGPMAAGITRQLPTGHPQYDPKTRGLRPKGFEGQGFANDLPEPIPGLEGPFRFRSGKVLYYDPKEGKYYDRSTDMYVDNDEMQHHHL